jgi:lipopolysaccharide/colanic/teichoic acid biosynthesis glycosyltransferase
VVKRIFDILFSLIVILIFFPFGILFSFIIVLESRGGVFYFQKRVGINGKDFYLYKFRTMRPNSDLKGTLTIGMRDPRITKVGYFLRKFKIDEFPQFINVLLGDMSIVGPRPEVREYVDLYSDDQRLILNVRPGITDFASLAYFDENRLLGESENPKETYIQEIMPAKINLNLKYIQNPTLMTDLKIIWRTFIKMIGL